MIRFLETGNTVILKEVSGNLVVVAAFLCHVGMEKEETLPCRALQLKAGISLNRKDHAY